MAQRRAALKVDIPQPSDDAPKLGRVAIIALVGFVIGMLWPRLAGVKLVPSPPLEEAESVASAEPAPQAASAAPALSKTAPKQAAEEEPKPAAADRVRISEPKVTSCRDSQGNRVNECDAPKLEGVAKSRIQTLGACAGAEQAHGTLSLGLELDFAKKKVVELSKGKSTTLPEAEAKALLACAKKEFESASLDGVEHQNDKYTVFYLVELLPPSEVKPGEAESPDGGGAAAGGDVTSASGRATVGWDVAIIRDKPKEGEVVARVLRGTRVVVTGRQDDWYRIKYDAKGSEGWVFRGALGL